MPFWKKSEDPWDWKPERQRPVHEEPEPRTEGGTALAETLRDLGKKVKTSAVGEEEQPKPQMCPWCGQEMEIGYLIGGRDPVRWVKERPRAFHLMAFEDALVVNDEGGWLTSYKTAWLCRPCKKMVLEAPEEPKDWTSEIPQRGEENQEQEENET